ncbi:TRAP transporter small permease [Pelagibacterium halotolerans]|uniref:TRAP transporter small permease protein n=1 Tax=Pelagibacterium halotolerans (strain DSM 22347 / JCM 15775 / CGMCC 1.7692 / B2) TaxID=1082931 RepID=G4RC68_PELHB|nr:TRAP transporter small permease [Pelagibacterium halotolerans]AEQ52691.1 TRAP-type C4-dicarboxylate transport system, small permease component [Pelagibacterium halotolerans B2]QJR17608.1 TRAP transporter small permease [Pelagibacterium halotolerans]SEA84511.1 TRAP-type C4-dicarboxylate transport system, small permease component [Pelagibacterium halotolerans]
MTADSTAHRRFAAVQKVMDRVNSVSAMFAGLCLAGMVLAVAVAVFVRLLYTYTGIRLAAPWGEEVARYLMIASVFIGGAVAAGQKRLIGVDAFVAVMPPRVSRWLAVVAHLLTLSLVLMITWQAIMLVEFGMRQWSPVLRMPMAAVYGGVLVGAVLMVANVAVLVVGTLLGVEDPEAPAPTDVSGNVRDVGGVE